MNRQWLPYITLCFTDFVLDMLRVNYTIKDTQKTVNVSLMIDVLISYFFANYYMCRYQYVDTCDVKKELAKYAAVRPSFEVETLGQYISHCSCYVNETYNVVTAPNSLLRSIYPWDFVDLFLPYKRYVETGETKEIGHNYPE